MGYGSVEIKSRKYNYKLGGLMIMGVNLNVWIIPVTVWLAFTKSERRTDIYEFGI